MLYRKSRYALFSVSSLCECGLCPTALPFAEHSMEASRLSAVE